MANSADPDQKPTSLDLHCLQMPDISGLSRIRVKIVENCYLALRKRLMTNVDSLKVRFFFFL